MTLKKHLYRAVKSIPIAKTQCVTTILSASQLSFPEIVAKQNITMQRACMVNEPDLVALPPLL